MRMCMHSLTRSHISSRSRTSLATLTVATFATWSASSWRSRPKPMASLTTAGARHEKEAKWAAQSVGGAR